MNADNNEIGYWQHLFWSKLLAVLSNWDNIIETTINCTNNFKGISPVFLDCHAVFYFLQLEIDCN